MDLSRVVADSQRFCWKRITRDNLSPSKKFRNSGVDRISDLPEDVLSHILSGLSTKEAVRTSVLSKSWENKWKGIYNIQVDHGPMGIMSNDVAGFKKFIYTVLYDTGNIQSFYLKSWNFGLDVETWLSIVSKKGVESVELLISPCLTEQFQTPIILPRALLSCSSLRELRADISQYIECKLQLPVRNNFPNITILILRGIQIMNRSESATTLICNFPLLEILQLSCCRWLKRGVFEIFVPALNRFKHELYTPQHPEHIIKIHGPNLLRFEDSGTFQGNFSFVGSTVHSADLMLHGPIFVNSGNSGSRIRGFMKECLAATKLRLSSAVTGVLARTNTSPPLPRYDMLKEIILGRSYAESTHPNVEAIFELLHAAPNLNVLVIDMGSVYFLNNRHGYDYETMEVVPSCIITQLEKVKLIDFENKAPQYRLAMFLLKNASGLKEFSVSTLTAKVNISKRLSKCPKASASLEVVIT